MAGSIICVAKLPPVIRVMRPNAEVLCYCLQESVPRGKQPASAAAAPHNGKQRPTQQQNGKAAAVAPAANGLTNGGGNAAAVKAERLKQEGNAAFKAGDFSGAVEAYGAAIELDPCNPVLYSNRAIASLKASPSCPCDHISSLEI